MQEFADFGLEKMAEKNENYCLVEQRLNRYQGIAS
jgi:hypothetical protein